jgi:SpoIIAA-like
MALIETKFLEEDEILKIQVTGTYKAEPTNDRLKEIIDMMEEHKSVKCLLDYREGKFSPEAKTAINRPKQLENLGIDDDVKFACVFKKITDDELFFEKVHLNSGYQLRLFEDENEALAWLRN